MREGKFLLELALPSPSDISVAILLAHMKPPTLSSLFRTLILGARVGGVERHDRAHLLRICIAQNKHSPM